MSAYGTSLISRTSCIRVGNVLCTTKAAVCTNLVITISIPIVRALFYSRYTASCTGLLVAVLILFPFKGGVVILIDKLNYLAHGVGTTRASSMCRIAFFLAGRSLGFNIGHGVTKSFALGCSTYRASLRSSTGCISPLMTKSFALGCSAFGAGLGISTSCIRPLMTKSFALGSLTYRASLGRGAICIRPFMTKSFALGCSASFTCLGGGAVCIYPVMSKSFTLGCSTYGAGLRSSTGCISPVVSCCCDLFAALGFAATVCAGVNCFLTCSFTSSVDLCRGLLHVVFKRWDLCSARGVSTAA